MIYKHQPIHRPNLSAANIGNITHHQKAISFNTVSIISSPSEQMGCITESYIKFHENKLCEN